MPLTPHAGAADCHRVRRVTATAALAEPFALAAADIAAFRRNGFVQIAGALPPDLLAAMVPDVVAAVAARVAAVPPLAERDTYGRAFLQTFNIWRTDAVARALVTSRRLAGIAAALLGVASVRLYHDQALDKEPGGGPTPWHADQFYWPLDNDRTVTAWIPLQPVDAAMGPLAFAPGSQRLATGRDLAIGDASEAVIGAALADGGFGLHERPFALGDVSFHGGWTFHRAGPNATDRPRRVMTVIYMDAATRLRAPANANEAFDAATWCPGVAPGEVIATPINPVLFAG
ncbi:MAG: phytanoyl-CoA dioxygenase family protein [Sphingomonadaceae bacterium]|nr:phytanoyl-CoA dioxygenase family protein [Sphingomonadaceae bacterium]